MINTYFVTEFVVKKVTIFLHMFSTVVVVAIVAATDFSLLDLQYEHDQEQSDSTLETSPLPQLLQPLEVACS